MIMNKPLSKIKPVKLMEACLFIAIFIASTFAWGDHHGGNGDHFGRHGFYRSGWYGGPTYWGNYYYNYGDVYWSSYPGDYVVVPEPVVITAPANQPVTTVSTGAGPLRNATGDTAIVNVPNSQGKFTAVKLVKHNDGYLGPQGEFYLRHPTIEQLKVLYGG